MYPIVEPYNTGYLYVGDDHELYYEECGNPDGKPVVFLHGGPGGAFSEDSRGLFDPERYRIILYDQRGAGHSRPFASIKANTIEHLVADIEKLKLHLGIEQWMVVGGSWGSALALLYTIDYPGSVTELIVSGISLGDPEGVNWFVEEGGASRLMPDWFAPYRDFIPPEDRTYGLAKAYYNILIYGADDDERVIAAAERFDVWDTSLLRHNVRKDLIREIEAKPEQSVAFARIFYHYVLHEYKNGNKWKILDGVRHLKHIPCEIVHGRYDLICPAENAWAVHEAYPGSNLTIIQGGGHSILDPGLSDRVIEVTDAWAEGAKAKEKGEKEMSVIFVYVTCATQEEAGTISRALLEKQMIACANVMVPHQSLYRWEGEIKEAQETVMILKTYESLFHELKREICALHSYSCPCVVALPVKAGHEPFLEWIGAQLHQ